jgi:Flp pilus assembly protein CpaB
MEAHRHFGKSASGSRGANDRKTAILVAAISAVLAAALIYLFVTHYHKTANPTPTVLAPTEATVWKATALIPAGTSEQQIIKAGLLESVQVPESAVASGAINSLSAVAGEATTFPIARNDQATANDFTKTATNAITTYIRGDQRGVAFSFDGEHGLTTFLRPTSAVDIMRVNTTNGTSKLLVKDVEIISNANGVVVLKLTDKQALIVTSATISPNELWLSMRPTIKPTNSIQVGTVGQAG